MKLSLINPRGAYFSNNRKIGSIWNNSDVSNSTQNLFTCPNLGLLTVGALAKSDFNEIEYVDENHQDVCFSVESNMVALSAMTNQINRAYEIADRYRSMGVTVIIGGVHVSVLPQEAAQHVDAVVVGEAEAVWKKLMNDYKRGKLKSVYSSDTKNGI